MEVVLQKNKPEYFNRELRRRNDTITWLSEVLDGSMRTSFDYYFDGNDLRAEDGSGMRKVFDDGVAYAEKLQWSNPGLSFELRRRLIETDEYNDMLAMARGELANTMVVVSDFPPELQTASEDIGGYNVKRKQTMIRLITRNDDGSMTMRSQSLDRSDRFALENIYHELGFAPAPSELLGQRMHVQIDDSESRELLIDRIVDWYDQSLESRYGQAFYAGRTGLDCRNTSDFVVRQTDLLDTYLGYTYEYDKEALKNLAATMRERFIGRSKEYNNIAYKAEDVLIGMNGAGRRADSDGIVFSGCGVSVSNAKDQMDELGFGNKICTEIKDGQRVKCPGCHETVAAIVPDKESIYCANGKCKLAHPKAKQAYENKIKDNREQRIKQQKEKKDRDKCKQPRPTRQPEKQRRV